jgi:hypothetical protein
MAAGTRTHEKGLWLRVQPAINRVVTRIAIGPLILFFLLITPVGMVLRLLGKDPLQRPRDPAAPTYWIGHDPPGAPPAEMKHRF